METCDYKNVETAPENEKGDNYISRKYLLRQVFVCSGVWTVSFCFGLSYGSPTVFIPQIRKEANSSDVISVEMASWLSSAINYSAIVCAVILAILARLIGRKLSYLFVCITSLIGYVILYCSTNVTQILISEIICGPLAGSPLTITTMILTEYTSPRYRGVFLTLKATTFIWGVWVANTIGTFFHWKNIVILNFLCCMYPILTILLWPKSPYWLANNEKLDDCAASHRWLKGYSIESQAELNILLQTRQMRKIVPTKRRNIVTSIAKIFRSKTFHKSVSLSMLVLALYFFSGKLACGMYAIDIIKRITGTESTAYAGMLILDGITVLGMYVGCGMSRILKRRTLLLVSSTIGVIFLFCLSIYLYLIHLKIILEDTVISIVLLICYSLSISVGPMIMSTTILGELVPVKYRSSSVLFLSCYSNFLMGSTVKICPFILNNFGVHGLFLFFAVLESVFTIINYKILPETKDKTLLEIQESLLSKKLNDKTNNCLKDEEENQLNIENRIRTIA